MIGIISQEALWRDIYWSVAVRAPAATTCMTGEMFLRMEDLGFPIAELTPDTFEHTKAPDCGGIICEQSCKEQFLYEVLDPANYMTPDVNVDTARQRSRRWATTGSVLTISMEKSVRTQSSSVSAITRDGRQSPC